MEGRGNGTEGMDGWVMGRRGWKVENGRQGWEDLGKRRSSSVDLWGKEGGDGWLGNMGGGNGNAWLWKVGKDSWLGNGRREWMVVEW